MLARKPPEYKIMPGTNIAVDAFSYGPIASYYFLTHFHADHYTGISKKFKVHCSSVTANLLQLRYKFDKNSITVIPIEEWFVVDGVKIFALDANHCPGAIILIFELIDGRRYLHTGDFRYSSVIDKILTDPFDIVYLDETFGKDSKYVFPTQKYTIEKCIDIVLETLSSSQSTLKPIKTLFLVGSYTIGKEKVALGISKALGIKIYCSEAKRKVLDCLEWEDLAESLTADPTTSLHLVSMSQLNQKSISNYVDKYTEFTHIVAFRPTGWAFSASWTPVTHNYIRKGGTREML